MGPALATRSQQLATQPMPANHPKISRGYASVAGATDITGLTGSYPAAPHPVNTNAAGIEKCPHAAAARRAAEIAQALAAAKGEQPQPVAEKAKPFNYESFYAEELEKKHQDKSYRYFNNINRLAAKFPVAHTGAVEEEVTVWCANDYLGMGKNPVVLDTIQ